MLAPPRAHYAAVSTHRRNILASLVATRATPPQHPAPTQSTYATHCAFRKQIKLPDLPPAKTTRYWINKHENLGEAGLSTMKIACDRHFCSIQGRSKAVVVELVYYPNSDIIEKVIERTDGEFIQTFRSCKVTVELNGKPKELRMPNWWLDHTDRHVKAEVVYHYNSNN